LRIKQRGGLMFLAEDVHKIILLTDRAVNLELIKRNGAPPPGESGFMVHLQHTVFLAASEDRKLFDKLRDHDSMDVLRPHVPLLIKDIAERFGSARLGHPAKQIKGARFGAASNKRSEATKKFINK